MRVLTWIQGRTETKQWEADSLLHLASPSLLPPEAIIFPKKTCSWRLGRLLLVVRPAARLYNTKVSHPCLLRSITLGKTPNLDPL